MQSLASFIAKVTPKFNPYMAEGLCYHRLNDAVTYLDNFIKYSVSGKTNTQLRYLGFREIHAKEEIKMIFSKATRVVHDIAENDIYLVEFKFQYGDEPEPRTMLTYVPHMRKGNIMHLSGNKFLVTPVLSDKVISVGDRIIFINILTAKYSFTRSQYAIKVNECVTRVSIIDTVLYKNQSKKLEKTTKAKHTVMHYLLANYGYTKTMEMLLGFVPTPVYDYSGDDKVVVSTTGVVPAGYVGDKGIYKPTRIKFLVNPEQYNEDVLYVLGNVFYVIDNFPDYITVTSLDDPTVLKRLLFEAILSGRYTIAYLAEKSKVHFSDLNSDFDTITVNKLIDVGVTATNLMELMGIIFKNYNSWILQTEIKTLYGNKSYEVESFALTPITFRITKLVLDINKEELRLNGEPLDSSTVDSIFKKHSALKSIFKIKLEKRYVTSIEYSGDSLYPKNTAMVAEQESDYTNSSLKEVNTSERKKITASMSTVGSILGLSKKNPVPLVRANPYVNMEYMTGTVLAHEHLLPIVEHTDNMLNNMVLSESTQDISDFDPDIANEELDLDDGFTDMDDQVESFDD